MDLQIYWVSRSRLPEDSWIGKNSRLNLARQFFWSDSAADGVIDEVASKLKLALEYPQIGEAVEYLRPNTRRLVAKKRFFAFLRGHYRWNSVAPCSTWCKTD